ncbi:MAG: hypothetical protein Tsb0034_05020 [Ekhidna sp.]
MKKALILIFSFIVASPVLSQNFLLGGGPIYGDDIKEVGINIRTYYNHPNGKICFGPEFSIFKTNKEVVNADDMFEKDLYEINFNGHYFFPISEKLIYYPVVGLNYSSEKETLIMNDQVEEMKKVRVFGLNIGSGLHFEISEKLMSYIEYDHLFSTLHQNSITFGILLKIGQQEE